jgi:hypothetical protein
MHIVCQSLKKQEEVKHFVTVIVVGEDVEVPVDTFPVEGHHGGWSGCRIDCREREIRLQLLGRNCNAVQFCELLMRCGVSVS